MTPMIRCMRLDNASPRAGSTARCCRLPCAQRRSRAAGSRTQGGPSSRAAPPRPADAAEKAPGAAGAADERGLDEVVGLYRPAEWLAPAQVWQAAARGERAHAQDGVVSPVVAVRSLPRGETARDDGAVQR